MPRRASTKKVLDPEIRTVARPLGPRVASVLEVAYRARRPVLLEGPTGIGKSELVTSVAAKLGIRHVVLDLSLLEPPDLVGLPQVEGGKTRYARPAFLPEGGEGILMLEELNRAERYIQQPALQLLTARRLHDYELPPGWACFAAINPETSEYQVTPMDAALRARFLHIPVRADRASWLAWAGQSNVHPAVVGLARAHERLFDDVPPRTWTYVSEVLHAMTSSELANAPLLRDVLAGYLPPVWVEALTAAGSLSATGAGLDVHAVLREYGPKGAHAKELGKWKDEGATDRIDELVSRLAVILSGPEAGVLAASGALTLGRLEALLADLPGDPRERLQDALGGNPVAVVLLDASPEEVLVNYGQSKLGERVAAWKADRSKHHRVALLVTAVASHVARTEVALQLRKSNAQRLSLGHFLLQIGEKWGMPLVDVLRKVGVTPIRPS